MSQSAVIIMDTSFWLGVIAVFALFVVYMSEIWTKEQPDSRITATITLVLVLSIVAFLMAKGAISGHKNKEGSIQHVMHHGGTAHPHHDHTSQ